MSALEEARAKIADAFGGPVPEELEPLLVFEVMPDAIPGPCFAIVPSEPALEPIGQCNWTARFDVICVAGRAAVEDAQRLLDSMVTFVIPRLRAAGITVERGGSDQLTPWANVDYLTRRVTVWSVVNI